MHTGETTLNLGIMNINKQQARVNKIKNAAK
jgi:hypothetical protein